MKIEFSPRAKNPDIRRRSLALPHRALCYSSIKRLHTYIGIMALIIIITASVLLRKQIWTWQIGTWLNMTALLGLDVNVSGHWFGWEQYFIIFSWRNIIFGTFILLLVSWLILRSPVGPPLKGLYLMLIVPIYLFSFVTFLIGEPPVGVLDHVGPEWLYGELILWILIPLLYALFIFPVPFSLGAKVVSLVIIMCMSIAWRTITPVAYIIIAVFTKGLFAIPAWMALGPWADYIYIIPIFSATLYVYRGDKNDDLRA